jgi:hypothetical protein
MAERSTGPHAVTGPIGSPTDDFGARGTTVPCAPPSQQSEQSCEEQRADARLGHGVRGVGAEQGAFQIHSFKQRAQRRSFVALFAGGHRAQCGAKQVADEREQRQRTAFAARAAAERFAVDGQADKGKQRVCPFIFLYISLYFFIILFS